MPAEVMVSFLLGFMVGMVLIRGLVYFTDDRPLHRPGFSERRRHERLAQAALDAIKEGK